MYLGLKRLVLFDTMTAATRAFANLHGLSVEAEDGTRSADGALSTCFPITAVHGRDSPISIWK